MHRKKRKTSRTAGLSSETKHFIFMGFLKNIFKKETVQKEEISSSPQEPVGQPEETGPTESQLAEEFVTLRDDGIRAMQQKQLPYAKRCFTAALEKKDDEDTKSYLAEVCVRLNEGEVALPLLTELVKKHPDEIQLHLATAQAAHQCADYPAMIAAAEQMMRLEPENPNGPFLKSQALFETQEYIQAVALLTPLLEHHADAVQARMLRAKVLFKMEQYQEAEKDVDEIISAEQAEEETYALKGDIRLALGDTENAIVSYGKIRDLNPFNQEAVLKTGKVLVETRQLDKALKLYDEAIDLQPDFAAAYKERGGIRLQLHDELGATDDLKKALELMPEEAQKVNGDFESVQNRMNDAYKAQNPFGF